jgi:hypothetical protein
VNQVEVGVRRQVTTLDGATQHDSQARPAARCAPFGKQTRRLRIVHPVGCETQ